MQSGLGRAVRCAPGRGPHAAHAPDHDHRTAIGLVLHHLVGPLRDVKRGQEIQLDDLRVHLGRRVGGVELWRSPGVVHHDVQAPEPVRSILDEPVDLIRITDVSLYVEGGAASSIRQALRLCASADHNVRSVLEKPASDTEPNAAHPTGYEDAAAGEVEVFQCHQTTVPSKRPLGTGPGSSKESWARRGRRPHVRHSTTRPGAPCGPLSAAGDIGMLTITSKRLVNGGHMGRHRACHRHPRRHRGTGTGPGRACAGAEPCRICSLPRPLLAARDRAWLGS